MSYNSVMKHSPLTKSANDAYNTLWNMKESINKRTASINMTLNSLTNGTISTSTAISEIRELLDRINESVSEHEINIIIDSIDW